MRRGECLTESDERSASEMRKVIGMVERSRAPPWNWQPLTQFFRHHFVSAHLSQIAFRRILPVNGDTTQGLATSYTPVSTLDNIHTCAKASNNNQPLTYAQGSEIPFEPNLPLKAWTLAKAAESWERSPRLDSSNLACLFSNYHACERRGVRSAAIEE